MAKKGSHGSEKASFTVEIEGRGSEIRLVASILKIIAKSVVDEVKAVADDRKKRPDDLTLSPLDRIFQHFFSSTIPEIQFLVWSTVREDQTFDALQRGALSPDEYRVLLEEIANDLKTGLSSLDPTFSEFLKAGWGSELEPLLDPSADNSLRLASPVYYSMKFFVLTRFNSLSLENKQKFCLALQSYRQTKKR